MRGDPYLIADQSLGFVEQIKKFRQSQAQRQRRQSDRAVIEKRWRSRSTIVWLYRA